ncbi:MAG TPA: right-handed parallel beta-helix repeat-containing protein [Pseudosphingobacterium sp.]|nr:right-handed parallel beta-helix repeat-containing protein [Pseudosphingobacterium sp.]
MYLVKTTIDELRSISSSELDQIKTNYYCGVLLTGYYPDSTYDIPIIYQWEYNVDIKDNGGSIIQTNLDLTGRFVHPFNSVVNVKYFGAKGNGLSDDTDAIQTVLDLYDHVFLPNSGNEYRISAHDPDRDNETSGYLIDVGGISLKNGQFLEFEKGAKLKAINANKNAYNIIRCVNIENFRIDNAHLIGTKDENQATSGEWGYGLAIMGCKSGLINNIYAEKCWGDGINLQVLAAGHAGVPQLTNNHYIIFQNGVSDNNRRQGASVEGGVEIYFNNVVFSNTVGTAPQYGVDIEPWGNDNIVDGVYFNSCIFKDNKTGGLLVWGSMISNVFVNNCRFVSPEHKTYHHFSTGRNPKNIKLSNCYFDSNVRNMTVRGGEIEVFNCELNNLCVINESLDDIFLFETKKMVFEACNFKGGLSTTVKNKELIVKECIFDSIPAYSIYSESQKTVIQNSHFLNGKIGCWGMNNIDIIGNIFDNMDGRVVGINKKANLIENVFNNCTDSVYVGLNSEFIHVGENKFLNCRLNINSKHIHIHDPYADNANCKLFDNYSSTGFLVDLQYFGGIYGFLSSKREGNVFKTGSTFYVADLDKAPESASIGNFIYNVTDSHLYIILDIDLYRLAKIDVSPI